MRFLFIVFIGWMSVCVQAKELSDFKHLGNSNAAVRMYLFSSYACPHCADFHQKILPQIQKKYIETNQAYLTFIDMAYDKKTLMPVLLMHCVDEKKFPQLSDQLYLKQSQWLKAKDFKAELFKIVHNLGMQQVDFDKCVHNQSLIKKVIEQEQEYSQLYGITKLPTLIVRQGNSVKTIEGADEKQVLDTLDEFVQ